jgi:ankyrin repeat protein
VLAAVAPALGQSQSSLADLIRAGDRKAALDRIRAGADVNEAQPDGTRPIHWAVYKVDYELIDALIAKKATVDVATSSVHSACRSRQAGRRPDGEGAAGCRARVDRADENGQTALMLAIKTGELPIVEMLVKAGANVNAGGGVSTTDSFDVGCHRVETRGRDDEAAAVEGRQTSKLALCIRTGRTSCRRNLAVQYRPVGGLTALLYAARNGCSDCVRR